MADASRLRDSTEIRLPAKTLLALDASLDSKFDVTVFETAGSARIIGSPVEIKRVTEFLARHGIYVR